MRFSSPTCRKRSGKIRSVMTLMPSARHSRAMSWACKIGRESRVWLGGHLHGIDSPAAETKTVPFSPLDLYAHFVQPIGDGDQMIEIAVLQFQFAVGDGGGDHERAAFDPVGDDPMLGAGEFVHALDADFRRAVALDLGAHLDEQLGAIRNFRLARRADQDRLSLRQRGGAHDVDRPQHGRPLRPAEIHPAALEPAADFADDVAVFGAEIGPELLQAADVQIDRPVADGAAAGNADDRLAALGQQRPQHADAGPHRFDDVVAGLARRFVLNLDIQRAVQRRARRFAGLRRLMAIDVAAQLADELGHRIDVAKARDALEGGFALGHEARGHDRQRAVLAAADFDRCL